MMLLATDVAMGPVPVGALVRVVPVVIGLLVKENYHVDLRILYKPGLHRWSKRNKVNKIMTLLSTSSILFSDLLIVHFLLGKSGQPLRLKSNHFLLTSERKWTLCKHHVDFEPAEERTGIKKGLMRNHRNLFLGYLFDGSTLYTIRAACSKVSLQ